MDWTNKDEVLEKVKINGLDLQYASNELKNDKDIFLEAYKQNKESIAFIGRKLKENKSFCLGLVENNGQVLYYLSDELRNDYDIVLSAVKNNGYVLSFASDELKKNRTICLYAATNQPKIMDLIDFSFYEDRDFAIEYINNHNIRYLIDYSRNIPNEKDKNLFIKECVCYKNPIHIIALMNLDYYFYEEYNLKNKVYEFVFDYLENTNFSLDYRIDVLRNMDSDELEKFFKERLINQDYDIEPLDINKNLEK